MSARIIKADGNEEFFDASKLRTSLTRAGATAADVDTIVSSIEAKLEDGMTTEDIYRNAFDMLKQGERTNAARYSLRRAMVDLGPTGFPFEDYLTRLFSNQGYATATRLIIQGKCAPHEVDVIAYRGEECIAIEAKFHLQAGTKSDLQVALYSYARGLDIRGVRPLPGAPPISKSLIVTNTKFTTTAIGYAKCIGLDLLSWDYPEEHNLYDLIRAARLYPVTVLPSLSAHGKRALLAQGTVLCADVLDNQALLKSAGISDKEIPAILEESARLCTLEEPARAILTHD